ncbi:MAG: gamma-glutamylcyclotransferase [Alphaproteobacteria bacterium]|nr:gamma-glutamylcyclotransferase [Alphaproteobacteria bacterium]
MLYFAYGSNLNHAQMKKRCKDSLFLKKINLKNFRLTFRSRRGWADIEPKRKSIVTGALFEITKTDEKKLDIIENYPILYKKYYFKYYGKKVMTYTMVKKTSFNYPPEKYLKIIKCGYKDCGLNQKFLKQALLP